MLVESDGSTLGDVIDVCKKTTVLVLVMVLASDLSVTGGRGEEGAVRGRAGPGQRHADGIGEQTTTDAEGDGRSQQGGRISCGLGRCVV